MLVLVMGESGSGKSAFAEELCLRLAEGGGMLYLATMIPYGEEGKRRVQKHRALRAGKGFRTLEWPRHIDRIPAEVREGVSLVLLESMANLVANVLFSEDSSISEEEMIFSGEVSSSAGAVAVSEKKVSRDDNAGPSKETSSRQVLAAMLLRELASLETQAETLVVVSDIYPVEPGYDEETRRYIAVIDSINEALWARADQAYHIHEGQILKEKTGREA